MSSSEPSETGVRVVLITVPDADTATGLGRALVEARLAACVNVVPGVRSFYRWEGKVQDDPELHRLAEDPEIQSALAAGDTLTLLQNAEFQALVGRVMSGGETN